MADSAFDKLYAQVASRATGTSGTTKGSNTKGPVDPMAVDTRGVNVQPEGYRKATALEQFMSTLNKAGEGISDVFGFGEKQAASRARIQQEDPNASEAELFIRSTGENILPFLGNLPGMMIGAIPSGISKAYEAITGSPVTEGEDGWIRDYTLDNEQKLAAGLDAAIDLVGVGMGGTGAALRGVKGLVTGGKVARKTAERAASSLAKQADDAFSRSEFAKADQLRKRAAEIRSGGNLTFGETLKEAKMFTTGNAVADLALETAEEGGEEFAQSIFEDVRGDYSGHKSWGDDIDMTKAIESAALGALGGFAMSGTMHGLSTGMEKLDKHLSKIQPQTTAEQNQVNDAIDYNFELTEDGLLAIDGQQQEITDEISKALKYKSAVLDVAKTNYEIAVDSVKGGLGDVIKLLVNELQVTDPSGRYFHNWLAGNRNRPGFSVQIGNETVNADNLHIVGQDILNRAKAGNGADLQTLCVALNNYLKAQADAGNGFQVILTKNPGGAVGYVRLTLDGINSAAPQLTIHQMTSTILNADFDSDMYAMISYDAFKAGKGNVAGADTRTTSQQWAMGGTNSWVEKNWGNLRMWSFNKSQVVRFFTNHRAAISGQLDLSLTAEQFEEAIGHIVDIQNVPNKNDKQVIIDGLQEGAVKDFVVQYQNFWSLLFRANYVGHGGTTLAEQFFSEFGNPNAIGRSIGRSAVQQSNWNQFPDRDRRRGINETNVDTTTYQEAPSTTAVNQSSVVSEYSVEGWDRFQWAKSDLFMSNTHSETNSKCRELLMLYMSIRDVTVTSEDNYIDIVEKALLNNLRLFGPGQDPKEIPVTTMQYLVGITTLQATHMKLAAKFPNNDYSGSDFYEAFSNSFKESHDAVKQKYASMLMDFNPNTTEKDINLLFPTIDNFNKNEQMLKCLQDVSISLIDPSFQSQGTFGELTTKIVTELSNDDSSVSGAENKLSLFVKNNISGKYINSDSKWTEAFTGFIRDLSEARITTKGRDARLIETTVENMINTKRMAPSAFRKIADKRKAAKNNGGVSIKIDFQNVEEFTGQDIVTIISDVSWLNAVLGKKTMSSLGWDSVNAFYTETEPHLAKIVDKYNSDNKEEVLSAVVTTKIISNCLDLWNGLTEYSEANTEQDQRQALRHIADGAIKLGNISPFYTRLVDSLVPGINNGASNISFTDNDISTAIAFLDRLFDADVSLYEKERFASETIGYNPNVINREVDRFSTFVSDAFASPFDQDDITSIASNIRKSSRYQRIVEMKSSESVAVAKQMWETTLRANNITIDEYCRMAALKAEELATRTNITGIAQQVMFWDVHPSKQTIDKTAALPSAESIQAANAIAYGYGYVNDDMDTINYLSNGPESIRHIVNTPQMFSRMMLTDWINRRGGITILDSTGHRMTFTSQRDFLSFLAGREVSPNSSGQLVTSDVVTDILGRIPEAIYAFMPTSISFRQNETGQLVTESSMNTDFQQLVTELKNNYSDGKNESHIRNLQKNKLMETIWSDDKRISTFFYMMLSTVDPARISSYDVLVSEIDKYIDTFVDSALGYNEASKNKSQNSYMMKIFQDSFDTASDELSRTYAEGINGLYKFMQSILDLDGVEKTALVAAEQAINNQKIIEHGIDRAIEIARNHFGAQPQQGTQQPTTSKQSELDKFIETLKRSVAVPKNEASKFILQLISFYNDTEASMQQYLDANNRRARQIIRQRVEASYTDRQRIDNAIKFAEGLFDAMSSNRVESAQFNWYMYSFISGESDLDNLADFVVSSVNDAEYVNAFKNLIALLSPNGNNSNASAVLEYLKGLHTFTEVVPEYGVSEKTQWQTNPVFANVQETIDKGQLLSPGQKTKLALNFIRETTSINDTQLDMSAVWYHHDTLEDIFKAVNKTDEFSKVSGKKFAGQSRLIAPRPNIISAEFASDMADQITRGHIPSSTSAGASERYHSVAGFMSMPNDIGSLTDAEVAALWAAPNAQTTWVDLARRYDDEDDFYLRKEIEEYRNGEAIGFYYRQGDNEIHPLTLADINRNRQSNDRIIAFTIFDENSGFDSKYMGFDQRTDQAFNAVKRIIRKLVIGVEGKALKAAKQAGLHPYASYTNLDASDRSASTMNLVLAATNGNIDVSDICSNIARSKRELATNLQKIYNDKKLKDKSNKENNALDISPFDLVVLSNLEHQYVNINFANNIEINGYTIDHVPVSVAALIYSKNNNINDLRNLVNPDNRQYDVTLADNVVVHLSDILAQARIRNVEIVRSSIEQINDNMFRDQLDVHRAMARRANNPDAEFDLSGTWHEEFSEAVKRIQNGSGLRRYEYLSREDAFNQFARDISFATFSPNGNGYGRLNKEGGFSNRGVISSSNETVSAARVNEANKQIKEQRDEFSKRSNNFNPFIVKKFSHDKNIPDNDISAYDDATIFAKEDTIVVDTTTVNAAISSLISKGTFAPGQIMFKQTEELTITEDIERRFPGKINKLSNVKYHGVTYSLYSINLGTYSRYNGTRSAVFNSPIKNYVYKADWKIGGDPGVYTASDNPTWLEDVEKPHTVNIEKPSVDGTKYVVQPATLNEIINNWHEGNLLTREYGDASKQSAVDLALRKITDIQNTPDFSNGHFNNFVNTGLDWQCIGFWKVIDAKTGEIQTLHPMFVYAPYYSISNLKVDLDAGVPQASFTSRFHYNGTSWESIYYGSSEKTSGAAVKEMISPVDHARMGYFQMNNGNINNLVIQDAENSGGKEYEWQKRINNYWLHMRFCGASMFLKRGQDNTLVFDRSIFGSDWSDRDIVDFFSNDQSKLEAIRSRLSITPGNSDALSFRNRRGEVDNNFNEAMFNLFSSFCDSRSSGHTISSVLSGIDVSARLDENGNAVVYVSGKEPAGINAHLLYNNRLTEAQMQTVYHNMSEEEWAPSQQDRATGTETWDSRGFFRFGHGPTLNNMVFEYVPMTVVDRYTRFDKNTDHITLNDVAVGPKLQAMAALDGDIYADRAALRAEQIAYNQDPVFYRSWIYTDNSGQQTRAFGKKKSRLNLSSRQRATKSPAEKEWLLRLQLTGEKLNGQDLFIQRQSRDKYQELIYNKDKNPMVRFNNGEDKVVEITSEPAFSSLITEINGFFQGVAPSEALVWEWIKLQLGWSYGDSFNWVGENDIRKALSDIISDLKTKGVPVGIGMSSVPGRYKVPVYSISSIDFIKQNLNVRNKNLWGNGNTLEDTIAVMAGSQVQLINKIPDLKQKRALKNMMQAYATDANMNDVINVGLALGVDSIEDTVSWANDHSKWMCGDEFFKRMEPVINAQEEAFSQWQKRINAYNDSSRITIDPTLQNSSTYAKLTELSSYSKAINFLCSSSKVMAMSQPLLAPISVAERFGYGGITRYLQYNSITGAASPYKSNVVQLIGKDRAIKLSQMVRAASKSKEVRMLIENRRMTNLLAEDGYTVQDIERAGGLEAFLALHSTDSGKMQSFYNKFMEFQTGKGILSSWQAEIFLNDLIRRISLSDQADFWFKTQTATVVGEGENALSLCPIEEIFVSDNQKNLPAWIYDNVFRPGQALTELGNRAFNVSMEGDAAKNSVATIWMSEFFKRRPLCRLFTTTTFCRFPMYAINITERAMNTFFPITALNYVLTRFASSEPLAGRKIPGLKGLTFGAIDWSNAQIAESLEEALAIDLQRMGVFGLATILLGISGAVEPPDDEDKWGNIDEWLFFGERVSAKWWFQDLLGPTISMVATWKAAMLGQPRPDIFFKGFVECASSNPIIGAQDALEAIFDPYAAYMEAYYNDVERFSRASDGQPDAATVLWANASTRLMSWSTQFVLPSFLREVLNAASEYETSYKKVYQTDAYGNVLEDEYGVPKVVDATYYDAKLRQLTRKNPILGFFADLFTGSGFAGDKTGYLAWEMPRTVYYDSTQLPTYQRLSLYTIDDNGNTIEKSEDEKQAIAFEVMYTLFQYTEDEISQMGFAVPYDTLSYVGDIVWDIAYDQQKAFDVMAAAGMLDPYVLGDGNKEVGDELLQTMADNVYAMGQFWKDFYYNKLWSDTMKAGLVRYNRYNTTYAVDDNGEVYATGIKRDMLSVLAPFDIAPKAGTLGYYEDWSTPSAATGRSLEQRALMPITPYVETPSWDSLGSSEDGHSKSYSKTMSSYGYKSGGSGRGYTYTGPNIYAPNAGGYRVPYAPNVNYSYNRPITNVDLQSYYIRPGFETKGSRKAYKREDI